MKSCLKHISLFIFLLVFSKISISQNDEYRNTYQVELSYATGKLMSIISNFPDTEKPWSIEAKFGIKTNGNKYWHQFFHHPVISINSNITNLGNNDVLGSSFAIFPTVGGKKEITKSFSIYYDFGGGLAYFNKPFSSISNAGNIVIGSRVTAIATGNMGFQYGISDNLLLKFGGAFRHYSNGHIKVPNVGGNLIYFSGGLNYHFSPVAEVYTHEEREINKEIKFLVNAGVGLHEVEGTVFPTGGVKYPVYFGSFGIAKRLSYRSRLRAELNYNYYTDYHDHILNQQIFYEKVGLRSSKVILFLGHELYFNHLSTVVKAGVNLYYPFRKRLEELEQIDIRLMDRLISGEFGLNYYWYDTFSEKRINPYFGIAIKTIGGKADYIQSNIGIQF